MDYPRLGGDVRAVHQRRRRHGRPLLHAGRAREEARGRAAGRRGFHGREARRHARLSRWRARRLPSLARRRRARAPPLPAPHRLRPRPLSHPGFPASRPPQGRHHHDRRRLSLRARPPALPGADHARRAAAAQGPRALVLGHGRAEHHRRRDRLDRSADRGARPSREPGSRLQRPGRRDDRRAREAPRRDAGDRLRLRVRRGLSAPDRSRLMSKLSAGIARSDVVGSLLRPAYLRDVRQRAREGAAGRDEVRAAEDRAVREAIGLQESAGLDVITDGELRRTSWVVTIPLREVAIPDAPLSGFEFLPADPGWWSLWKEPDGSRAQAWTSPTRPFITKPLAVVRDLVASEYAFLRAHARTRTKLTIPAPSWHRIFWHPEYSRAAYPTPEDFLHDVLAQVRGDGVEEVLGRRVGRSVSMASRLTAGSSDGP